MVTHQIKAEKIPDGNDNALEGQSFKPPEKLKLL
jgi:hypothetical protein